MTLIVSQYELFGTGPSKPINFTPYIIDMDLKWGLNASRASCKVTFSQQAKPLINQVVRGSAFNLRWGFSPQVFNQVTLWWVGTNWSIGQEGEFGLTLVHKGGWTVSRGTGTRLISKEVSSDTALQDAFKQLGVGLTFDVSHEGTKDYTVLNATPAEELSKIKKDSLIKYDQSGKNISVVSFETLAQTAQIHQISTSVGFSDKITITYEAQLPKDKSFIELGGGGSKSDFAQSDTNTKPPPSNADAAPDNANSPQRIGKTYSTITSYKNLEDHHVLSLYLVGKKTDSYLIGGLKDLGKLPFAANIILAKEPDDPGIGTTGYSARIKGKKIRWDESNPGKKDDAIIALKRNVQQTFCYVELGENSEEIESEGSNPPDKSTVQGFQSYVIMPIGSGDITKEFQGSNTVSGVPGRLLMLIELYISFKFGTFNIEGTTANIAHSDAVRSILGVPSIETTFAQSYYAEVQANINSTFKNNGLPLSLYNTAVSTSTMRDLASALSHMAKNFYNLPNDAFASYLFADVSFASFNQKQGITANGFIRQFVYKLYGNYAVWGIVKIGGTTYAVSANSNTNNLNQFNVNLNNLLKSLS